MTTIDATGTLHDAKGRFAGRVAGEGDTDLSMEASQSGNYGALDRDARLKAMQADLSNAVEQLVESGQLTAYLDARAANGMSRWSTNNQLLAAVQVARREGITDVHEVLARMGTIDARGAKAWNAAGRKITSGKGSALYIQAPVTKWISVQDKDDPDKTVRRKLMVGTTPCAVFDVTQTDGDPVPQHPSRPAIGGTQEMLDGMRDWVVSKGYSYEEKEIPGCDPVTLKGTMAYVEPRSKSVVVDSRLSVEQKVQAASHEIGHVACGHVDDDAADYTTHRGRMESEAEAFSYLLRREGGLSSSDCEAFSPGYIAGWSRGDTKTVTAAIDHAAKSYEKFADEAGWNATESTTTES